MIDVARYGLVLEATRDEIEPWLHGVLERGRDAAFVDTGYIRALLDSRDDRHGIVLAFHEGLSASLYTSSLVVAEAARQFAKADRVAQSWRWGRVEELARILALEEQITICAPPADLVRTALHDLPAVQRSLVRLDLCDYVSMLVLEALSHRRVLGFDNHFRTVGASLEP